MFDIVFVFVLSLFSLLSFLKGFVRSAFSFINWILSLVISYFATPLIVPLFAGKYPEIVLYPIIATILFIVSIIIFGIVTAAISRGFLNVIPEFIDKSFGFLFGFVKGYIIMALFFAILTTVYASDLISDSEKSAKDGRVGPDWLVEAKSYSILQIGADMLQPLIDKVMDEVNEDEDSDVDEKELQKTEPKKVESKKEEKPAETKPKEAPKKTEVKAKKAEEKPQETKSQPAKIDTKTQAPAPKKTEAKAEVKPQTKPQVKTEAEPQATKPQPAKIQPKKPAPKTETTDQSALDKKIDEINKAPTADEDQQGYNEKEIAKKNQLIDAIQ